METLFQWLRQLMFFIDNIVYSLIGNIYELIIYLANVDLVSHNSVLGELVGRIYLLLGIFMLFKVAFSMIQYLIDPNSFSDSSKGFGKLVTNTLISIVLLVSVPFIFEKAYEFQGLVLESNAINRLILGEGESYVKPYKTEDDVENTMATNIRQMAVDVQFTLFSAFYTLNTSDDSSGIPDCAPDNSEYKNSNVIGSADMVLNEGCFEAFAEESAQEMKSYGAQLTDFFKTADSSGKTITDNRKFDSFGKLLWWKIGGSGSSFTINYTPIISTIVGAYLVFLLLAYAVDIAARAIKLMFLQMIAPIAIVSYIDPKESISNGKLNNWIKESLSTYVSLFLRLAIIFLAIRLVSMLTSMLFFPVADSGDRIAYYNDLEPTGTMNMFIYVFLILGIFSFAKEFPKMIEKIFGISGGGNLMHMDFLKKAGIFTGGAVLGHTLGGLGGSGANAIAYSQANRSSLMDAFKDGGGIKNMRGALKNVVSTAGGNLSNLTVGGGWKGLAKTTIGGGASGALRGMKAGANYKGSMNWKAGLQGSGAAIAARNAREDRQKAQGLAGIDSKTGRARDTAAQVLNRTVGYRGKSGTETGISHQLQQIRQAKSNWDAQEEQIRQAITLRQNSYQDGKFMSQIQMLRQTKHSYNTDGDLVESRVYKDYAQFENEMHSQLEKQAAAEVLNKGLSSITADDIAGLSNNSSFITKRDDLINSTELLDEQEFNNITSLVDSRIHASAEGNKLGNDIKRLEKGQNVGKKDSK